MGRQFLCAAKRGQSHFRRRRIGTVPALALSDVKGTVPFSSDENWDRPRLPSILSSETCGDGIASGRMVSLQYRILSRGVPRQRVAPGCQPHGRRIWFACHVRITPGKHPFGADHPARPRQADRIEHARGLDPGAAGPAGGRRQRVGGQGLHRPGGRSGPRPGSPQRAQPDQSVGGHRTPGADQPDGAGGPFVPPARAS